MFKKVAFTMYPITDVPRARALYEKTLGLKLGSQATMGEKWWIEYDLPGGGCLALTNFTGEQPSASSGGTIALEVEDLDGADRRSQIKRRRVHERHHREPGVPHVGLPRQRRQLRPAAPAETEKPRQMDIDREIATTVAFPSRTIWPSSGSAAGGCVAKCPARASFKPEAITDLYITGTRLRSERRAPISGGAPMLRLTRKVSRHPHAADRVDLPYGGGVLALLAASLPGVRIKQLRHRLQRLSGVVMAVDEFEAELTASSSPKPSSRRPS